MTPECRIWSELAFLFSSAMIILSLQISCQQVYLYIQQHLKVVRTKGFAVFAPPFPSLSGAVLYAFQRTSLSEVYDFTIFSVSLCNRLLLQTVCIPWKKSTFQFLPVLYRTGCDYGASPPGLFLVRSLAHLYFRERHMTQGILPTSSRQVQA